MSYVICPYKFQSTARLVTRRTDCSLESCLGASRAEELSSPVGGDENSCEEWLQRSGTGITSASDKTLGSPAGATEVEYCVQ